MAETAQVDDAALMAEVATLARRAGLKLSRDELVSLIEPYRKTQAQLQALRDDLEAAQEPATRFEPIAAGSQEG